jgi:hypothetical protein
MINEQIDIGILEEYIANNFEIQNLVVTEEVYLKARERSPGVYKDVLKELRENWEKLVFSFFSDLEAFHKEYENTKQFICKLFNCMNWVKVTKTKEDLDLLVSTVILKNKGIHPVLVSSDKDIIFCSNIIFSYMGFVLRIFSPFEFLVYLGKLDFLDDIKKYANYYNLNLNLKWLETEASCDELRTDIYEGFQKGVLSSHFSRRFLKKLP